MDHLWKQVKSDVSANYQFVDIDERAVTAEKYVKALTNHQAKIRVGSIKKRLA